MIALKRPAKVPAILEGRGKKETKKLCDEFDTYGELKTKFKQDIYGDLSLANSKEAKIINAKELIITTAKNSFENAGMVQAWLEKNPLP